MSDEEKAQRFEEHRAHLWRVARRLLGDPERAEDAVQETWLRLARSDVDDVANLGGWLTTVVSRVCLDVLRAASARAETPVDPADAPETDPAPATAPDTAPDPAADPERAALTADAVGRALSVVLDTLGPAERVAFVLHDVFAVPFDDIGPVLERSGEATKKLAARARRRVHAAVPEDDGASTTIRTAHRPVVDAFLAAIRVGDMQALLAVLAPDVVRRVDPVLLPAGAPAEVRGAQAVAAQARSLAGPARAAVPALVDGRPGAVVTRDGRPTLALALTVVDGRVAAYEVIGDPDRLARLAVAEL